MQTQTLTILGIDVGSRQIGVSIFEGTDIQHYAVKTISGLSDADAILNAKKLIREMIDQYSVHHVAVEKIIFVQQHRSLVKVVYDELVGWLRETGIPYTEYNPKKVRGRICRNRKPTKANTMARLTERYGELDRYFSRPKAWQHRYYSMLLNTVAVGYVCALEVKEAGATYGLHPTRND